MASVLMSLGSIQEAAGDHTAAIGYYQRALKITQSHYGVYSPAFAASLHALGRVNSRIGKKNEAAGQYKQAISILMKDPSLKAGEELQSTM
ncbi:tetratricopeptide repeat protein, partial [Klebsiella pneumoniae]